MDVKQEINLKHLYLPYLTLFYCTLSEATEKLTITVTLVQEVGIDTMVWWWIRIQLKISQTLHVFLMFKLNLQKYKGLSIKIKVIKGFSAKLKVLKDCNQIKGF